MAVVSDLHGTSEHPQDSYNTVVPPDATSLQHPLEDLVSYVDDSGLKADVLLCAGDLTNKADQDGAIYVWRRLNDLADAMNASELIATPGNHDVLSRSPTGDPRRTLMNLSPSFPSRDRHRDADFWINGFVIVDGDDWRVISLNTCIHHSVWTPGASDVDREAHNARLERGELERELLTRVRSAVIAASPKRTNVLLCHHHLLEHEELKGLADHYGVALNGNSALKLMEGCASARWLVVHGHKHIPRLLYAFGASNAPVIFGAGSVGSKLSQPMASVVRNQFHIIEFSRTVSTADLDIAGSVRSWIWGYGQGWTPSQAKSTGLPAVAGFGFQTSAIEVAKQIVELLPPDGVAGHLSPPELAEKLPHLAHMLPQDVERLEAGLRDQGISLLQRVDGTFVVGRWA